MSIPGINPFAVYQLTGSGTGQNMEHAKVNTTSTTSSFSNLLTLVHVWNTHPTTLTSLTSLMLFTAPNSIASGLKLPLSTNHINYTNPWETDHFMSTWLKPPLSPNIHHKKLLTQCDCETKTKGVVGKKYSEKYNVFLYSAMASLFSFSHYKTWCHLVRSFLSFSAAKRALSWQKHLKQIAHHWH